MFRIRDEYGSMLYNEYSNYDLACRVAYQLRKLGFKCFVVRGGRAMSETFLTDPELDGWAYNEVQKIMASDYESRLENVI